MSLGPITTHTGAPSVAAVVTDPVSIPADGAGAAGSSLIPLARIALLGASGYSGQEFVRLALSHPGLELAVIGARDPGSVDGATLPGLDPRTGPLPPACEPAAIVSWLERGGADTVVSCLPHGAWRALVHEHPALASLPLRVVDLSSDHRDAETGYAYGLPEAFRDSLAQASRIANPGCYPTAFALAVLPVAAAGLFAGPVAVSALSGASGAGRGASLRTSFVELESGASIYRPGTEHPHVAEMERTLVRLGAPVPVSFVPQLVPMARGILLTATVPLATPVTPGEARALYAMRFAREPFVRMLPEGEWPQTRAVRGSNRCDLAVTTVHGGLTLIATAALDNLVKGAAGQAIQNLNLLLGWPETTGLPVHGVPW